MFLFRPPDVERMMAKKDVAGLIKALEYKRNSFLRKDSLIRQMAAEALGRLGDNRALDPLIAAMGDASESVGQASVTALGALGGARAADALVKAMRGDHKVCVAAVNALEKMGSAVAVEPVAKALLDKNPLVRLSAAELLGKLGDIRSEEPLIQALGDREESVGIAAAKALAELKAEQAVEPLMAMLQEKDRKHLRVAAVEALGKLGNIRAVESLLNNVGDPDSDIRCAVVKAMSEMGRPEWTERIKGDLEDFRRLGESADLRLVEPLIQTLDAKSDETRVAGAKALGLLGDARAIESLIIRFGDSNPSVRRAAGEALGSLGAEDALLLAQNSDNKLIRNSASVALGKMKNAQALEPLLRMLENQDPEFAWEAAEALGKLGDVRAMKPLIHAMSNGTEHVRVEAAEALGMLGDVRAIEPLIASLTDDDSRLRKAAAIALAELGDSVWTNWVKGDYEDFMHLGVSGDPRAVQPLIAAMENSDGKYIPQHAARALGKLRDARALEPLIKKLRSDNSDTRRAAAEALGDLGVIRAIEPLTLALGDRHNAVRKAAAEALGQLGEPKWKEWVKGDDNDFDSLGCSGDPCAAEPLSYALTIGQNSRQVIVRALGKLGSRNAVESLIGALGGETAEEAATALGGLGDSRAVKPLIRILGYRSDNVRKAAAAALEKLGEPKWKTIVTGDLMSSIVGLGKSNDGRAAAALIEATNIDEVQTKAVQALVDLNEWEPLLNALGDSRCGTRKAAAAALGRMGVKLAVGPLIRLLGDSGYLHFHARQEAADALDKLGESTWKEWVKGEDTDFERLGSSGDPRAVEPLLKALKDGPRDTIPAIASALSRLGNPAAIESLIGTLGDSEWSVRKAAAASLIEFASKQPHVLVERWDDVATRIQSTHTDFRTHSDNRYPSYSDCSHSDHRHEDKGIGMTFPDKPQNLDF